jgi:hypothetical protein
VPEEIPGLLERLAEVRDPRDPRGVPGSGPGSANYREQVSPTVVNRSAVTCEDSTGEPPTIANGHRHKERDSLDLAARKARV